MDRAKSNHRLGASTTSGETQSSVFKEATDDRNVTYSSLSLFFFPYKSDSFFTDSSNSERRNCFAASLEVKSTVNLTATLLRG